MMMVQYLLDAGAEPEVPGVSAPETHFSDIVAPVELALAQEKRVSEQIGELASIARAENDYASEQFMQWFIKEQVEEVSSMSDLLTVVGRSRENPMLAEEYLARERGARDGGVDPTAPPVAGGAV
jgi:ferritin